MKQTISLITQKKLHSACIFWILIAGIFTGCFQSAKKYMASKVDGYKPILSLYKNKTFELKVNLCQGIGTLKGTYTDSQTEVTLHIQERDFSGFKGDSDKTFTFQKVSPEKMIFLGDVACSPKVKEEFYLQ